jgi:hypothetical protein
MSVGEDISYYYVPLSQEINATPELIVGSSKSRHDLEISKMLSDPDLKSKISFIDITSAEFLHSIRILGQYAQMASIL